MMPLSKPPYLAPAVLLLVLCGACALDVPAPGVTQLASSALAPDPSTGPDLNSPATYCRHDQLKPAPKRPFDPPDPTYRAPAAAKVALKPKGPPPWFRPPHANANLLAQEKAYFAAATELKKSFPGDPAGYARALASLKASRLGAISTDRDDGDDHPTSGDDSGDDGHAERRAH